eukprot:m.35652 g.35652  ORF g.35652 m.35652 type:complete len:327 (-) comp5346_c0_seq1:181-1161(-)
MDERPPVSAPKPRDAWNARVYQLGQPFNNIYDSVHETDVDGDTTSVDPIPDEIGGNSYVVGWSPRSRASTLWQSPWKPTVYSASAPAINQQVHQYDNFLQHRESYEAVSPSEHPVYVSSSQQTTANTRITKVDAQPTHSRRFVIALTVVALLVGVSGGVVLGAFVFASSAASRSTGLEVSSNVNLTNATSTSSTTTTTSTPTVPTSTTTTTTTTTTTSSSSTKSIATTSTTPTTSAINPFASLPRGTCIYASGCYKHEGDSVVTCTVPFSGGCTGYEGCEYFCATGCSRIGAVCNPVCYNIANDNVAFNGQCCDYVTAQGTCVNPK